MRVSEICVKQIRVNQGLLTLIFWFLKVRNYLAIGLEAFLVSEQSYQIVFACVQKEPWAIVWKGQIDPLAMNVAVAIV